MHRPELNFTDGNLWQLRERNDPIEEEQNRADWLSGKQNGVSIVLGSGPSAAVHVQNDRDRLVLVISLVTGDAPSSLMNETMPWRHRGQAIEPGGP